MPRRTKRKFRFKLQIFFLVAAMCYTEDSLETTARGDHKKRKMLYERLGDGACLLKHYSKAIKYYQKMLREAELNGDMDKQLSPCYISLAQTYKDHGEFNMALQYFQKEYNINKDNIEECVPTLFNIADVMEAAGNSIEEVNSIYLQTRKKCQLKGAKNLECKTIKRHADFLRSKNKTQEAIQLERELTDLNYVPSDDDSDENEENDTPNIGEELDIGDITDVSDENETAEEVSPQRARRLRNMIVKKNAKGETQLHTACINGNISLVKKLLEQGHPVDVRDHCGWLPIHEACINGHLEIVKVLVEHKADFNDRGGKQCLGKASINNTMSILTITSSSSWCLLFLLTKGVGDKLKLIYLLCLKKIIMLLI